MKNFLRFFSLTTATQFCLAVNQLVLLPLQLRVWGQEATSHWFVIIAVANLASVADLGLRMAGHAQLLSSVESADRIAELEFRRIWALTRVLIMGMTSVLIAGQVISSLIETGTFELWAAALTMATALDTALIVRGFWLDTLGHFVKVEALFLGMVSSRILLSILAMLAFHAGPGIIAYLTLVSAAAAVALQAYVLPEPRCLALLANGMRDLRWKSLGIVRFVVAEPASNWMRLSLPVIVLAAVSSPRFVTTYVALRAIFGMARQIVNQLGRYASIRYAQFVERDKAAAENVVIRFTLLSTLAGLAVSSGVIADHCRLFRLWLSSGDPETESLIALYFATGAIAYGYQVVAGVLMRCGDIVGIASRQYAYLIMGGLTAGIGWLSGSAVLYLLILAAQELLLAGLFVGAIGYRVLRSCLAGFALAAVVVLFMWTATEFNLGGLFTKISPAALGGSLAIAAAALVLALLVYVGIDFRISNGGNIGERRIRSPS